MTKSPQRWIALALSLAGASSAFAGGPVYSRFGIGDIIWFGSSRAASLGGLGLGLRGDGFINLVNPAGLSGIARTRFEGAFHYNYYTSESGGAPSHYGIGGLQSLAFAIPISVANGIVLGFDTGPYSTVAYTLRRSDTDLKSGIRTNQTYYGRGGLNGMSLSLSSNIVEGISGGARLTYLSGKIGQLTSIDFVDGSYTDDEVDRSAFHQGVQLTLGGTIDRLDKFLGVQSLRNLTLGATVTLPSRLNVESNDAFVAIDTIITSSSTTDVPLRLGLGLAYRATDQMIVVADFSAQLWKGATVIGRSVPQLRDAMRISAGVEWLPKIGDVSYFQRVGFRLGGGYTQTPVQIGNTSIDEIFVTGGFTLPVGPDARINLGLQAGSRGTTDGGMQKDTYLRLNLGISGSELWFVNFEED